MKILVTPEEALATILASIFPLSSEKLPHDAIMGRTLTRNMVSGLELPPFDNAAMDGYAVIAGDLNGAKATAPVALTWLETIGAGGVAHHEVKSGQCLKIMTGAPIPQGADAVVMREATRQNGGAVEFSASPARGEHIRRAGSDVGRGETVLRAGDVIGAAQWAMLASLGAVQVEVFHRPRVGIITTGAELVAVDAPLTGGQIRDSNSYALRALVENCGAIVETFRHCGDTTGEFEPALREVSAVCDVVVTSGGVSAGDFDPVRDVLRDHAEVHFWKIAMKPGKPVMFAHFEGKPVFGLPGNPVSVMVAFEEFARPALLKMGGRRALKRLEVPVRLETSLHSPAGKREYVRAQVRCENGSWSATMNADQGSGRLSTMTNANALLVVPPHITDVAAGEALMARLINCPEIE